MNWSKQSFTLAVSASLVLATAQTGCADTLAQSTPAPLVQTVDESPNQLDQLVAPIALYPDNLVAQILAASTWSGEVVEANRWMQQHSGLSGTALAQAVNQQAWDPSVKALTQFPLVLANMDKNLSWSTALGNAYASEPQNVLSAIQVMRSRAQQAGHLTPTDHEVVTNAGNAITIQPADAGTVYLPEYDPWLVYGAPVAVYPDWVGTPGLFVTEPDILFGLGIGIGIAGFGWGWHHWGADWHERDVVYNHSPYRFHGHDFANHTGFDGTHMAFGHVGGFHGGSYGAIGVGNRGFDYARSGFNRGTMGGFGAHGGLGFGRSFHAASGGFHGGGFHSGGFHGGGFHGGGGHR
jgi:hypothetical protein